MANANQKGKRGERMACKLLEKLGFSARRSQQYSGVRTDSTSADIITDIQDIRFEVKYGYKAELWHKKVKEWIQQAKEETPSDKAWAILYKKTGSRSWTIIFELNNSGAVCQSTNVESVVKMLSKSV